MKTEINIYILFSIILIHWFADFVLQTHEQATNKSKSNYYLTMHVLTYTLVWFAFSCFYGAYIIFYHTLTKGVCFVFLFPTITFVCHWITDYLTSRLNTYLYNKGDIHNFFVSVGFDQLLHYAQLLITFQLLTK
jgi:hypothetical protein